MSFFDPIYAAVNNTIAGAGSAVAGGISGLGEGLSSAGRSTGDSIANMANGYADYIHDSANYIRDKTGAEGARKGTAANPLGLSGGGMAKKLPPAQRQAIEQRKKIEDKSTGRATGGQGSGKGKVGTGTAAKSARKNVSGATPAANVTGRSQKALPAPKKSAAPASTPASGAKKPASSGGKGGTVTGMTGGMSPAQRVAQAQKAKKKGAAAGGKGK